MTQRYKCISYREFCRRLMRKRPVAEDSKLETPLKRCLNASQLTLYCVAHMIGAGLYVLTGQLIRDYAGSATALAYLVSAFTSIFTALCYAEFTTLFPRAGSAYLYTYLMFGELPAFLTGWTMIADVMVSSAAVAKAFSGTINWLSNGTIRNWTLTHLVHIGNSHVLDSSPDLVSGGFLLLLVLVTLTGANFSLTVNAVLSAIQICCLIVITVAFFVLGTPDNFHAQGGFFPFGVSGVLRGAGLAVFAFSGFEAVANASEEAKNPRRDLPIALFSSLLICGILYVGVSLGLAYIVPRNEIVYDAPFVAAFSYVNQSGLMWFSAFATLLATGATKLVAMYVIPRLFYAIASDGLLFECMSCVESRTKVPMVSLIVGGLITILLSIFIKIQVLAEFTSVGVIFSYFLIGLNLMVLRYLFVDEHHVIENDPTEKRDMMEYQASMQSDQTRASLIPPPTELWLRPCIPNCIRGIETRRCFHVILTVFICAVIGLGITINTFFIHEISWLWILSLVFIVVLLATFAMLCAYEPMRYRKGFETPAMPVAPCVTMLTNGILITCMEPLTWLRFGVWSALGKFRIVVRPIFLCYTSLD
ncbi:High affinity cationic amino acid transporter 1 [Fasciola gigantica]|uniref:High affinity cationic amino acid transporter 1 n=1 Tax=Fasciola gigantica TaxID=46835 RepID=A0A504YNC3_FASGI|nr:High affinity cationic amino acid transporter 1 [Fasciola gigantica]